MRAKQMYCTSCNKSVLAQQQRPNFILHLLLIVLTCGLWLPFFVLIEVFSDHSWRCPNCGSKCVSVIGRRLYK
jgi:predicted RNA-binding Zn-ribbon protein involved in translation (DUF1610 family)